MQFKRVFEIGILISGIIYIYIIYNIIYVYIYIYTYPYHYAIIRNSAQTPKSALSEWQFPNANASAEPSNQKEVIKAYQDMAPIQVERTYTHTHVHHRLLIGL